MKYMLLVIILLGTSHALLAKQGYPNGDIQEYKGDSNAPQSTKVPQKTCNNLLRRDSSLIISVTGQGVAPSFATSHAQAYALAKRAALADAYRLISEKVKGVRIEGQDLIKNMMVKRTTVRTSVEAMVRNSNIVGTTFKDGLCEVEVEIRLSYNQFNQSIN